ncbi:MAG: alpha-N-arabinofuranosidase, partial [Chloroflexota bacterium]|nr:alpha-N-arabinofuranosidase [Chloroflexota bacterium]
MTASETATTTPAAPASDVLAGAIGVDTTRPLGRLDDRVYGHFLESNFFGNIEGGVFDEGSPLALSAAGVASGLRRDVIEACRRLAVPIVRWPGGNFASAYHWEDGIGPRDARPRRLELTWGGVESNRFGTDEFLAWCAAVGAEPYLNNSCRSVEEAVRWVEYTNHAADTHFTRLRAANGHPAPYAVRYWGLGNEAYGRWQMGHRPAEQYAADAREHAHFMRLVDPTLKLVAVGWRTEAWTQALLRQAGGLIDYVSIHLYGASRHLYTPEDDEFESTVGQALHFEQELRAYADLVAQEARRAGVERPLALALDEWNIRHLEPETWP